MLNKTGNLKRYQEILLKINDIIREDQLGTGDQLPSERELSERLGVGRSSVREALRALELLGLISTRRGEGTFIEEYTSHRLVEILAFYILRDDQSSQDLLEIRKLIELDAIRLAVNRIEQKEIDDLEAIINQSEEMLDQGLIPVNEDYIFHQTIALASGNFLLYRIWKPVADYGKTVLSDSLNRVGRPEVSILEHRKIVDALKSKDLKKAEEAMKWHLEQSEFYA